MKTVILLPLIAICLVVADRDNLKAQPLSFTIQMDKTSYAKKEPVNCTLTIKNTGNKDVVVNNRFLVNLPSGPHDVSLVITDKDNNLVPFTSMIRASFTSDEFVTLHPGNSTKQTYKVNGDFDFYFKGDYHIVAYYENKSNPPVSSKMAPAWKGTLISNKANFSLHW